MACRSRFPFYLPSFQNIIVFSTSHASGHFKTRPVSFTFYFPSFCLVLNGVYQRLEDEPCRAVVWGFVANVLLVSTISLAHKCFPPVLPQHRESHAMSPNSLLSNNATKYALLITQSYPGDADADTVASSHCPCHINLSQLPACATPTPRSINTKVSSCMLNFHQTEIVYRRSQAPTACDTSR